jgi:hypothetical protein
VMKTVAGKVFLRRRGSVIDRGYATWVYSPDDPLK